MSNDGSLGDATSAGGDDRLSAPDAGQRNSDLSNLIIGHSLPDRKAKVDLDS
jgi:hypothetical protein